MAGTKNSLELIIGKNLKELRGHRGISQENLSLETGLDRSYISMLERGKRTPTLKVIFKLCEVLKVSPTALVKKIEEEYEGN